MPNCFKLDFCFCTRFFFKVFTIYLYKGKKPHSLRLVFQRIGIILTILVEGPQRNICAKHISNLANILGREAFKIWHLSLFLIPQQPKYHRELNSLNNFERAPHQEHTCEIIFNWSIGLRGEPVWRNK